MREWWFYKTTDGGENWEQVGEEPYWEVNDLQFINETNGYVAMENVFWELNEIAEIMLQVHKHYFLLQDGQEEQTYIILILLIKILWSLKSMDISIGQMMGVRTWTLINVDNRQAEKYRSNIIYKLNNNDGHGLSPQNI